MTKTERWLNLLAFLLDRHYPVPREEILSQVEDYMDDWVGGSDRQRESVRRKFERDKAELKALGVVIEPLKEKVLADHAGQEVEAYLLKARDFYLPYLEVRGRSVGYTDTAPGAQYVPKVLFWKKIPKTGTFLVATGDGRSRKLMGRFARVARGAVPDLDVVTLRVPLRGWLVPDTRLSDNASFWDEGYPSLMLTDTAYMRNPHYHRSTDRFETLDFEFMRRVAEATAAAVRDLAGTQPAWSS